MTKSIKINSGNLIPADTIRFIRPIDDEERARLVERYGADASGFNVSIQFADRSSKLATQTLDELRAQGIGLVNIGANRHVVAENIKQAAPFNAEDAKKLTEGKGYQITQTFRSRVDTTAGPLLSSATPEQVMQRRAKALAGPTAPQGGK